LQLSFDKDVGACECVMMVVPSNYLVGRVGGGRMGCEWWGEGVRREVIYSFVFVLFICD
jgi:hypothetical protein